MNIDFIQIGANVGHTDNDPVWPKVQSGEFKTGILIEANPKCLPKLLENYEGFDGLLFENIAIGGTIGETILYVDNYETEGTSQHASTSLDFQRRHGHGITDTISEVIVKKTTLLELWERYKIQHCKWLFIDAEGQDYEILINTDFSKLNIDNIAFEHSHIDGVRVKSGNYRNLLEKLGLFGFQKIDWRSTNEDTVLSK